MKDEQWPQSEMLVKRDDDVSYRSLRVGEALPHDCEIVLFQGEEFIHGRFIQDIKLIGFKRKLHISTRLANGNRQISINETITTGIKNKKDILGEKK
jgi:hypothetical protein